MKQEIMGVAVVSAGPYANHLHSAPDNHASTFHSQHSKLGVTQTSARQFSL